jgi:tetratricopeptide (TPR) repeat protein/tRNA A-37 threonylcarbamoyl transferase component Bud32
VSTNRAAGEHSNKSVLEDPFIGLELDERYRVDELIGAGGFGNVYKATDLQQNCTVAVKIVHKHHLNDESSIRRFELEAQSLRRIQSDYIVKITDFGVSPAPYIVMEHFDGQPLGKWLKEQGPMKAEMAIELFLQLCDGLSAAESMHIVHRDLKPANILIKIEGDHLQAKILDFGLAKNVDMSVQDDNLTATGEILGSPPYMSPEQWRGQCDYRSDIYSLGCIMYEVLSGKPPFSAQFGLDYMNKHLSDKPVPISQVNSINKFPSALESVVSKCLQKTPSNRYQSSSKCSDDLKKIRMGSKPTIIVLEDIIAKNKRLLAASFAFWFVIVSMAYCLREPLVHSMCADAYERAAAKLACGQKAEAASIYQDIVNLSGILPEKDLQKLPALRALETYHKKRNELAVAKQIEKRIDLLIGRVSTDAEMSMITYKLQRYVDGGNLAEAEALGHSAMDYAGTKVGKHSMCYCASLNYMGTIAFHKGFYGDAITYYKNSLAIAEELLEPNNFRKADIMDRLALALTKDGKEEEASKYSEHSKLIRENKEICLTVNKPTRKDDLILWEFPLRMTKSLDRNKTMLAAELSPLE